MADFLGRETWRQRNTVSVSGSSIWRDLSSESRGGWQILSVTLRIFLSARDGKRKRTLTATLSAPPNTTSLPNKTESDRQFVYDLLERWELLTPAPASADPLEVVE